MPRPFVPLLSLGVFVLGLAGCATVPAGDAAIRAACTQLVLDYAYHRDRTDAEAVGALFTDDARMTVQGETYIGRDVIEARTRAARDAPTIIHLMSTIHIRPESATRARGTSYVTVYVADSTAAPSPPPEPTRGMALVGAYEDLFVRTADGWRIAERTLRGVFRPADDD